MPSNPSFHPVGLAFRTQTAKTMLPGTRKVQPSRTGFRALTLSLFLAFATLYQNNLKAAASGDAAEYDVKAAFLLNFIRFVEWPQPPPERMDSPFAICILGDDPFGNSLTRVISGETIGGRRLVVRRLRKWPDACEVLFMSASHSSQAATLALSGSTVLTVGEAPGFLRDGGMIKFVVEERRVRFDINREAVERSALKMSSRLFAVAREVVK